MTSTTRRRWRWAVTSTAIAALAGIGAWMLIPKPIASVAIPVLADAQLDAVAETTVLFGHQSVGMNILDGIADLYAEADRPAPTIVESSAGVADRPAIVHAFVGVNGDPLGKFAAFRELVDGPSGDGVSIALVKLCYVDITASSDVESVFAAYASTMADLEARHPDVTFLYTTVPLTTDRSWKANLKALFGDDDQMGPADNVAREQYNALIRGAYESTGRLFDIAAVQSRASTHPAVRSHDGTDYYVLDAALSSDAGHLNAVGGRIAAAELIRVVADVS